MNSVLALIPARGGSKGIPRKNLLEIGGKPLIVWTIDAALRCGGVDRVVVSTDDDEIAATARAFGAEVPFLRPAELARDDTPGIEPILHALAALEAAEGYNPELLVVLQPTSPFRSPEDINQALRIARDKNADGVVSVCLAHDSPYWMKRVLGDGSLRGFLPDSEEFSRRQDLPAVHAVNGALYLARPGVVVSRRTFDTERTFAYVMPRERSLDIDAPLDAVIADHLLRARDPAPISVSDRLIGPGRPCFVLAEAGVNHNGSTQLAVGLIDAAARAGADAIKFQTFEPELLASSTAAKARYQEERTGVDGGQLDMLRGLMLPKQVYPELMRHAKEAGLVFLSTPFDEPSADFLHELGVPAFKVSSGDVTNLPFLEHMARRGRPMLLSTGMSSTAEVAAAVHAIRAHGNPPLALLHCVSNYPASAADCNLRAIGSLQSAFGVPAGWSDHTEGIDIGVAAAALGAALLEKHLTLDRAAPGPDHRASLEPTELAALVRGVRRVAGALGDGVKTARPSEREIATLARRSLFWAASLASGHTVRNGDLVALRPALGITPANGALLIGRRLARPVMHGSPVTLEDFADTA